MLGITDRSRKTNVKRKTRPIVPADRIFLKRLRRLRAQFTMVTSRSVQLIGSPKVACNNAFS